MNLIMKWLVVGCVAVSCNVFADSINDLIDGTRESIIRAESYVSEISDDADMGYIVSILSSASLDWDVALKAQEAVSLCLEKKGDAPSAEVQADYEKLEKVSAQSAEVHANSVRLAAAYVQLSAQKAQENLLADVRIAIEENEKIKQLVSDNVEYTKRQVASKYK